MKIDIGGEVYEELAYRDTWGKGTNSYISMMYERLLLMKDLLAEDGSIYVHCDWRVNSYIRIILDEIFGKENYRNEIVWSYRTGGASVRNWSQKHDTILFYSKTDKYRFNTQKKKHIQKANHGRREL